VLLRPPTTSTTSSHTADDFATFCVGKVANIRQATSSVPPPVIQTRHVAQFSHFSPVTSKEITDLLAVVPSKCCSLDLLPTWIINRTETFSHPFSAHCATRSCRMASCQPVSQKHAIVLPRLKKPGLDPTNLSSYRPISNLSLLSKLVERVVTVRFISHVEENKLFPNHQSSYR